MLQAKATTFLDFGKTQLVQLIDCHKINTQNPLIIGRLISLVSLDKLLFAGVLKSGNDVDLREYRHPIVNDSEEFFFEMNMPFENPERISDEMSTLIISELKNLYFYGRLDFQNFLKIVISKMPS